MADPAIRRALYDRFMLSQSIYQVDPWAEHAATPADWAPIADLTLRAAE
jgi:nitrite reductase (NADH) large subunit